MVFPLFNSILFSKKSFVRSVVGYAATHFLIEPVANVNQSKYWDQSRPPTQETTDTCKLPWIDLLKRQTHITFCHHQSVWNHTGFSLTIGRKMNEQNVYSLSNEKLQSDCEQSDVSSIINSLKDSNENMVENHPQSNYHSAQIS